VGSTPGTRTKVYRAGSNWSSLPQNRRVFAAVILCPRTSRVWITACCGAMARLHSTRVRVPSRTRRHSANTSSVAASSAVPRALAAPPDRPGP
jgi:hypothetical protein